MKNLAAIVLAAGTSSRLGQPKQFVKFKGETLVTRVITTLSYGGYDRILVVTGYQHEKVKKEIQKLQVEWVYNQKFEDGMGSSISCGIKKATNTWPNLDGILLSLCDQPLLDDQFIKSLNESFYKNPEKIIASAYNGTFGPPVIFPKNLFDQLKILQGKNGAKPILKEHSSQLITMPNQNLAVDIDKPSDLKNL